MIKHFCDVCGQEADNVVWRTFDVGPDWTGYHSRTDGSGCDGTFTPGVRVETDFRTWQFKDRSDGEHPDLCLQCQETMLRKLADVILARRTDATKAT